MARDDERGFGKRWGNGAPDASKSGDGPADLVSVRRDDQLLDALAVGQPFAAADAEEYALASLLGQWRAEIDAVPMPAGPDLDAVVAAVNQEIGAQQMRASAHRRGKLWLVRPLAGAAALAALAIGGMTALSYNATPGEPLWKVKEVVFSGQAASTVANIEANRELAQAQQAIDAGDVARAQKHLDKANGRLAGIGDAAKKSAVAERASQLQTSVSSAPVTTTPPGSSQVSTPAPSPSGSTSPGTPRPSTSPKPSPSPSTPRPTPGSPSPTTPPPVPSTTPARPTATTVVKPTTAGEAPSPRPLPSPVVRPPVQPTSLPPVPQLPTLPGLPRR